MNQPTEQPQNQAEVEREFDDHEDWAAESPARLASWFESVSLPRWVIYLQATLLGVVATTCFFFGMMVGSLTAPRADAVDATFDCRVAGTVLYRDNGDLRVDEGAVVFLLPKRGKPPERSPAKTVNPDFFQPLDNNSIDNIAALGGAVVRVNESGKFDVTIDASYETGIDYYLLVVSKNVRGVDTEPMTKEQSAMIGTFFMPIEEVVDDRSFYWQPINANSQRVELGEIEF